MSARAKKTLAPVYIRCQVDTFTVHKLDEKTMRMLRKRAALSGRTAADEARDILLAALNKKDDPREWVLRKGKRIK
jgi:plasmid stability protein